MLCILMGGCESPDGEMVFAYMNMLIEQPATTTPARDRACSCFEWSRSWVHFP